MKHLADQLCFYSYWFIHIYWLKNSNAMGMQAKTRSSRTTL